MGNIEFRILKNARCIHFLGTGDISFAYLMRQIMNLHGHPDFDPSFNSFIDFEDATVSFKDGGLGAYQSFFESLQQANIHRKWAIYSRDPVTFQSANMSHLLLSGVIEVDVFQKRSKALAFLGIADADLGDG
ncbi:hypothetical protein DSCA_38060 [Desulfosarcina alkanivorans]|uniref:STAS/SEC14 domain-containing protein n=1 Tax=Desulfosarcina alkanivorans TaxID=571177 RepID=A0A5K7YKZ4_9BACT|nr:hypothetical protein [Desulfosarcina alkanivorans]BBO69876.1 hypothetical protein DSCA_38060 [Desulfosarcina alkanivorans]